MAPQDSLVTVGAEQGSTTTEMGDGRDRVSETVCPRPWVRDRVSFTGVRARVSENLIMPTTPALNKGSPLPCILY